MDKTLTKGTGTLSNVIQDDDCSGIKWATWLTKLGVLQLAILLI